MTTGPTAPGSTSKPSKPISIPQVGSEVIPEPTHPTPRWQSPCLRLHLALQAASRYSQPDQKPVGEKDRSTPALSKGLSDKTSKPSTFVWVLRPPCDSGHCTCWSAALRQPQATQPIAAGPLSLLGESTLVSSLSVQKRGLLLFHSLTFSDGLKKPHSTEEEHMSPHSTTPHHLGSIATPF